MNTTENNKLLAEFMGGLYNNQSRLSLQSNEIWLPYHGVCNYKSNNGKCLQYHSSWDWLIPVVEKIVNLKIFEEYDTILFYEMFNTLKIEVVYNACVTFIEWYNKQTTEENK